MSDTPWTPGPWKVSSNIRWSIMADDPRHSGRNRKVADAFCGVRCGNFDHTESDANAELIALAPELAEAVLALVDPEGYTPLIAGRPMQHSLRALAARLRQIGAGT